MFGLFNAAPDANADTGAGITPEGLKARRALARALAERGSDASPVKHWLQGAARLGDALNGAIENYQTDKAESAALRRARESEASLLGGGVAAPASTPAAASGAPAIGADPNEVSDRFIRTVQDGGVNNPYALAAIGATGQRESSWSPKRVGATWSDPSESGEAGTSGGTLSWRGPRLAALQGFARESGEQGLGSPETQARFFLRENPQLVQQLNAAKSPEEAMTLMNNAWRFAGFNRPGGERDARLAAARSWAPRFATSPASGDRGNPTMASEEAGVAEQAVVSAAGAPMASAPMPPRRPAMLAAPTQPMPQPAAPQPMMFDPSQGSEQGGVGILQGAMASGGANPVQSVAQAMMARQAAPAPAQAAPAAPMADAPAQGATPAQGQQAAPQAGGREQLARALAVLNNPFSSAGAKAVAQAMIQREQRDPNDARLKQLQVQKAEKDLRGSPNIEIIRDAATGEIIAVDKNNIDGGVRKLREGGPSREAPPTRNIKQPDGSEVAVQWNPQSRAWEPLAAPQGGNAVRAPARLTEQQSKDLVYYNRGLQALEMFGDGSALTGSQGLVGSTVGQVPVIGNFAKSEAFQRAEQAGLNFLASILRKDTGAAVTAQETQMYGRIFLPQPGDTPDTIRQKTEARKQAIDAIRDGLGTAEALALGERLVLRGDARVPKPDKPGSATPTQPQRAPAPQAAPQPAQGGFRILKVE